MKFRADDLVGKKFGKLTVIEQGEYYISPKGHHQLRWKCVCECGNTVNVATSLLLHGKKTSCGCVKRKRKSPNYRFQDLTNSRFGELLVLERVDNYVSPKGIPSTRWRCKCDCGNLVDVNAYYLTHGKTTSCGHNKRLYLIGQKFNRLTVISESTKRSRHTGIYYTCQCDCGNIIEASTADLRHGDVQSCGCLRATQRVSPSQKIRDAYEEYYNTTVPDDFSVIPLDGNMNNHDIDNLLMVSKSTANYLYSQKLNGLGELTECAVALCELKSKLKDTNKSNV